jgi:5-methyltetrahydropteroyltriglutamate--homocysteine methyltransferase
MRQARKRTRRKTMKRSTDRILTTHVGSLVRPPDVLEDILLAVAGNPVDQTAFNQKVRAGVTAVVHKQAEIGIDIPSDGEFSKPTFTSYVSERLSGLGPTPQTAKPYNYAKLTEEFPGFMKQYNAMYIPMWMPPSIPSEIVRAAIAAPPDVRSVTGPIKYQGQALVQRDITNFKAALHGQSFVEAFMPSATPSRADVDVDQIYPNESAYLYALADAMHEEYQAIVDAGFLLQIDDPDLPDGWNCLPDITLPDYRKYAAMRVDALNHALRGIPREKVRLHVCWGSHHGPHHDDIPLKEIIDLVFRVNAGSFSIEASNPCHEHEWRVFEDAILPEGATLIPGVVGHCSDFIEHPDLVAERLVRYANLVGRENVLAGTDCGLGTRVGHPSICWAKFETMAEGARRATKVLWGRT